MHVDVDKLYLGDYQFTIELDTGSETGGNQLTVWCAKKVAIETVSLKKFGLEELMQALVEPYRTLLAGQLADELTRFHESFETKIVEIQAPFVGENGVDLPLPGQARRQLRSIQHQKKQAQRQLERDFLRRELLQLDRKWFNWELLEKVSRVYGQGRFLRSFYFGEANEKYIYNFCRKFALNTSYQAEVLAGRARWFTRNALFYRNILHMAQVEHRVGEKSAVSYDTWLYHLFLWLDRHCESILSLPEYQRLQALDGTDEVDDNSGPLQEAGGTHYSSVYEDPNSPEADEGGYAASAIDGVSSLNPAKEVQTSSGLVRAKPLAADEGIQLRKGVYTHQLDERIRPAVEVFRQIPGIRIVAACQGVAGTVDYLGRNLLPLSTHDAQAHILFEILEEELAKQIRQHLSTFGTISCEQWGREKLRLKSIDIEHNAAFCAEMIRLGKEIGKGM